MRYWLIVVLTLTVLVWGGRVLAQDKTDETAARAAAEAWLALVDGGQYAASWEQAAAYFKGAVTSQKWAPMIKAVRGPLGAAKSRTLRSLLVQTSLPGAPDGEYVVIQFNTVFEHKAQAIETVTPMKDPDGQWRVSGYYIK